MPRDGAPMGETEMTKIYEQHDAAFANVSAYVILQSGERVATVALKVGAAVTAYVHMIGLPMVRGRACGGGYDSASAAVAEAIDRIPVPAVDDHDAARRQSLHALRIMLRLAAAGMDAGQWVRELERQGFTVLQAV